MREDVVRRAAQQERDLRKATDGTLVERMLKKAAAARYDVFLSHAYADRELVLGLTHIFESAGLSVYVDWIEDPKSGRRQVTAENADMLRDRMARCDALVVAYSLNASISPWVTWELAYFDGIKQRVAVLPIEPVGAAAASSGYAGQEYLQLYPFVDEVVGTLFVNTRDRRWTRLSAWTRTGAFPNR